MNEPNWNNRTLFHGDNLAFMRAMNSESVHLIATDPPFKKGRDFHATPDSLADGASFQDRWSWERDVHQEWVDQITDDFPKVMNVVSGSRNSYGDDMGAFLCFMAVRLLEMHRILRLDGSLYLHCDPTASHYLKELLDAIFGHKNFRNEIVWHYDGPQRPSKRNFGTKHDVILRYAKTEQYFGDEHEFVPEKLLSSDELTQYKQDEDGRYYYDTPKGDYTDKSIERLKKENRVRYTRNGKVRIKHFLRTDTNGRTFRRKQQHDVWHDITSVGHAGGREKSGYPTQKPWQLAQI